MLCYYGDDMEEYRRWEDNIKMDLKEVGVDVMSWLTGEPLLTEMQPSGFTMQWWTQTGSSCRHSRHIISLVSAIPEHHGDCPLVFAGYQWLPNT